jgi:hypothetical protein
MILIATHAERCEMPRLSALHHGMRGTTPNVSASVGPGFRRAVQKGVRNNPCSTSRYSPTPLPFLPLSWQRTCEICKAKFNIRAPRKQLEEHTDSTHKGNFAGAFPGFVDP